MKGKEDFRESLFVSVFISNLEFIYRSLSFINFPFLETKYTVTNVED